MGKLIVMEGTDGAGKETQCAALERYFSGHGIDCRKVEFPRYESPASSLIRMYLAGEFGKQPGDVNPFAASAFYAVDRYASFRQEWQEYYKEGGLVLADRYTTSNAIHQGSKLEGREREDYFRWLFEFEYHYLGLPEPDLVFYLRVPIDVTERNMKKRAEETGSGGDIHENNLPYLRACAGSADAAAEQYGWKTIECTENGAMRTIEEIHLEIVSVLEAEGILRL